MLTVILAAIAALKTQRGVAGAIVGKGLAAASHWLSRLAKGRFVIGGTLLAALAAASWITPAAAERLLGINLAPLGTVFDLRQMFRYGPMFAFGIALWHQRDLMAWVLRPAAADLPMALAGSIIAIIAAQDIPLEGVIGPFGACLAGFFWAKLLIATAARWLDRPSRLFGTLADAAFSVYLFHFPIVLGLGLVFLRVGWPPLVEFTLILVITAAACLTIHAGIRRSALLSFLFNGKPMPG
jgi:glucan biosynthesis protein C